MEQKKTVLVLFGGVSSEHEISRVSAASVLRQIDKSRYEILKAGITKEGKWLLTGSSAEAIEEGAWEEDRTSRELLLSLDSDNKGFWARAEGGWEHIGVDVVFPILHGKNGEDGTVQGMLQIAGIPFVGSDTASSAACMDKAMAKAMISQAEAADQARCCIIYRPGCDPAEAADGADAFFGGQYPLFVKPARAGSSVGISKVKVRKDLAAALETAFAEDSKVLVEETIVGRELEVAVLGNEDPAVSKVGEIFTAGEFYDYEAKYDDIGSRTAIVTDLPEEKEREIRETALRIYRVLECRGLARVDFFLTDENRLVFNEINTMPGFTRISMYPALWEASGIPYSALIDELIRLAVD